MTDLNITRLIDFSYKMRTFWIKLALLQSRPTVIPARPSFPRKRESSFSHKHEYIYAHPSSFPSHCHSRASGNLLFHTSMNPFIRILRHSHPTVIPAQAGISLFGPNTACFSYPPAMYAPDIIGVASVFHQVASAGIPMALSTNITLIKPVLCIE